MMSMIKIFKLGPQLEYQFVFLGLRLTRFQKIQYFIFIGNFIFDARFMPNTRFISIISGQIVLFSSHLIKIITISSSKFLNDKLPFTWSGSMVRYSFLSVQLNTLHRNKSPLLYIPNKVLMPFSVDKFRLLCVDKLVPSSMLFSKSVYILEMLFSLMQPKLPMPGRETINSLFLMS